jgi:hypothetical protein
MFCVSTSPEIRASALAKAAFPVPGHPIRSFINSIDRFIMFCRLYQVLGLMRERE